MRIETPEWKVTSIQVREFEICGDLVKCENMDGSPFEFPLKNLIWCNKKRDSFTHISYREQEVTSGCEIKSMSNSTKYVGFAEAKMPDGSTSLFNKRLNRLIK